MEIDLAIDVREVSFDEFERRKRPRENRYSNELKSNLFSTKELQVEYAFGIEVHEIPFEQFARQKAPN